MSTIDIFWEELNTTDSCAMMSAFWRQKQVQDGMATARSLFPFWKALSVLFQRSHKGFVKAGPNMAPTKKKHK